MRTVLTKKDVAFEKGFKAYEKGALLLDNPYPIGSRERTSWYAGWEHGQQCGGKCNG